MQDKDFSWFVENYDKLFAEYGTNYLAIKNKKVFLVSPTFAECVHEASKKEELGSFIVQLCNGSESAYTNYIASTMA